MAGKRANGEGNIRKRADGRWEATLTLPTGGRKSYYRKTRAEASDALTKALRELAQGLPVVAEKQTVADYLRSWLESAGHSLAPRTRTRYRAHVELHLIPAIGKYKLATLSYQPIQSLYAELLEAGAAPATVRQLHAVLRQALGEAHRLGLAPRNVATLVRVPRAARTEMHVWNEEQARTFLMSIEGERLEALYVLAIRTGLRLGELLALRWVDVDLEAGAVHVTATLRYQNADIYYFDPPKTAKSRRRVAIGASVVGTLRAHRTQQLEERMAAGPAWRTEDLVFCTEIGGALCGNHISDRAYQALIKAAGVPKITFHDLRHTCATLLLRQGIHPKIVSEMLGHTTVAMTLDRYSHVLPDMQAGVPDAMDRIFG